MKSDGSVGFTQLERKWLQHLGDMQPDANSLLQKIKQHHFYLHVFVEASPIFLLGAGYFLKCFEKSFSEY